MGLWAHATCCRTLSCTRIFLVLKGSFAETHRERLGEHFIIWHGTGAGIEMLMCRRRRSAVPRQEGQMPRGGFFFVGCTQRDSAEGATAPIGAAVYEKNTTRALCPPQKYICSLRSGKKKIWTVVERDAISQNILLFRGPMGPLDLAHGASSNAAPRPMEPFQFDRRISAAHMRHLSFLGDPQGHSPCACSPCAACSLLRVLFLRVLFLRVLFLRVLPLRALLCGSSSRRTCAILWGSGDFSNHSRVVGDGA